MEVCDSEAKIVFRKICLILLLCLAIGYMTFHFFHGRYTLANYLALRSEVKTYGIELQNTQKRLELLQSKIEKMQDENIDSDLFDEQLRQKTGYIKPNEIVIYSRDLEKI